MLNRKKRLLGLFLGALCMTGGTLGAQNMPGTETVPLLPVLEAYQGLLVDGLGEGVMDPVRNLWLVNRQAISDGQLRFTVNPDLSEIFDGASFVPPQEDSAGYIVVTQGLLNVWARYPSLFYTLFTGAVADSGTYFLDPAAWEYMHLNVIDFFFMRVTAYNMQMMLVRDRLVPAGLFISPYESFLLDSAEKDNLASVVLFLDGQSLPVARSLLDAGALFENSGNVEQFLAVLLEMGENLLEFRDALPAGAPDNEMFGHACAIHTWLEFTPELVSRIYNKDRTEDFVSFDQVLEQTPEYAALRQRLEASRIRDTPLRLHVVRESRNGFFPSSAPDTE